VSDPKIAAVAKRCGNAPKHLVVAFWAYLLEIAASANPKGSIDSLDIEGAAIQLDASEEQLVAILNAMEAKGMIEACQIVNWNKRQHGKSTERVREFRERKKRDETECNVSSVTGTPTGQDITGQDNTKTEREDAPPPASPPPENVSRDNLSPSGDAQLLEIPEHLRAKRAKKRTRLESWDIAEGDPHVAYARECGMDDPTIAVECEKFENHHKASGSLMADWGAAWRKWCCNWQSYGARRAG
jgi:hypothetical protein